MNNLLMQVTQVQAGTEQKWKEQLYVQIKFNL